MIIIPQNINNKLPKTGQTTSYTAGDDGDYEAGWNLGTRFLNKTINGDMVVIDRTTGLMWPKNFSGFPCNNNVDTNWANAFSYIVNTLNPAGFASFSDWILPNIQELFSIVDTSKTNNNPFFSVFTAPINKTWWSSTTWGQNTGQGKAVSYQQMVTAYAKTFPIGMNFIPCRRFST
ncbi:MAG: DUF1566 domain-containing protein [Phycisphaerae bacterium]|nr:DUF1566 domain-containing protein [Phycisphaerae bacterium]